MQNRVQNQNKILKKITKYKTENKIYAVQDNQ